MHNNEKEGRKYAENNTMNELLYKTPDLNG